MVAGRGSRGGKKLWRCEVRPHLNPLPGGEEVASPLQPIHLPDPSGGQAPRLAKSSTALHLLVPPSTIGLQFGTFRRWRAGIEVDWRAHPGSESGTCFRTNRSCRLVPAHQGVKTGVLTGAGVCGSFATHTPTLDSGLRRNDELGGRHDECEGIPTDAGMTRPTVVTGTIHPGSEPGTCFRTNRPCRLLPAHQGMKMRPGRWKCLGVMGTAPPLWIPAFAGMTSARGFRRQPA